MKNIIAFAGSNNPRSINHRLILATAGKFSGAEIRILEIAGCAVPIYSESLEASSGIPQAILKLYNQFEKADGFIIASPEHNGLPSAFFKNIIDWLTRIDQKIFQNRPVLLISASPGKTGGSTNLGLLESLLPRWGGRVSGRFSLGNFNENFDLENNALLNEEHDLALSVAIEKFHSDVAVQNRNIMAAET